MCIRKFILAVFIVFAMSFSFQPVSVLIRERELIAFVVLTSRDNFTDDFINKNETRRFTILISLTMKLFTNGREPVFVNTS